LAERSPSGEHSILSSAYVDTASNEALGRLPPQLALKRAGETIGSSSSGATAVFAAALQPRMPHSGDLIIRRRCWKKPALIDVTNQA
jgi:hypothetical protein